MSLGLQAAVGVSFGALMLTMVWRFCRSRWSTMTVREATDELRRGPHLAERNVIGLGGQHVRHETD